MWTRSGWRRLGEGSLRQHRGALRGQLLGLRHRGPHPDHIGDVSTVRIMLERADDLGAVGTLGRARGEGGVEQRRQARVDAGEVGLAAGDPREHGVHLATAERGSP